LRKISISLSYPQDRAFIAYYDPDPVVIAGLKMFSKADASVVYVPGFYCGPGLGFGKKIASKKQMKIIMDGNSNQDLSLKDPKVYKTIQMLNLFMLNADEAFRLTGKTEPEKALEELHQFCPIVVLKAGAEGAYAISDGKNYFQKALKVKAIDTTGAGDCFNAGFIKAWLTGKSMDECLRWGNVLGGLSTLGLGGIDHVTHEEDVLKALKEYST